MKRIYAILFILFVISNLGYSQNRNKKIESLYKREDINRDIRVVNASWINTKRMEFSPAFYQNGLVYVSQSPNGIIEEKTGQTFNELFYADIDPNG
ncbi:MAG: hypothetical protein KDD04_08240, partial [Sinomicrobium sp.]|nr:hypothetical protein [Sinomicrobium sp.]